MRIIKHICLALLMCGALGTPSMADDAKAKAFLEQFNRALDQFASASGISVQYADADYVSDPMIGDYVALKSTDITVTSGELTYIVNANRIVLFPTEEDHIYDLNLPASLIMKMRSEGQEQLFKIELGGRPKMQLRHTPGTDRFDINVLNKERQGSPFTPRLSKQPKPNEKPDPSLRNVWGELRIDAAPLATNGWAPIRPAPQGILPKYIEKLCEAFNGQIQHLYPAYGFKGCVWFQK